MAESHREVIEAAKRRIVEAALPDIPFEGWEAAIRKQPQAEIYFPRGAADAIAWQSAEDDVRMEAALAALPLGEMRVPQKVKAAIMLRLRKKLPQREASRKALALLSFPTHLALGAKLLYATADRIWHAIGDRSVDYNFYTKRLTLAGIYGATVLFWLDDDSDDLAETEAFLERRLGELGRFGKAKKQAAETLASVLPSGFASGTTPYADRH